VRILAVSLDLVEASFQALARREERIALLDLRLGAMVVGWS